jgi:hypothetical protein
MMTTDQINLLLHTNPAAQLCAGIGATLVLASTVALVLKQTVAKGQPHAGH